MATVTNFNKLGLLLLLLLAIDVVPSLAEFDVMFEKIEQVSGANFFNTEKIRVRKYNRTCSVLDGIITLSQEANDEHEISVLAAYSSKGNNQFNQYPMKIAPQKICEFLNTTWRDYYDLFKEDTNFPEIGECPVTPKEFVIKNHLLDAKAFPRYMPTGLWKLSLTLSMVNTGDTIVNVTVLFKLEEKGIL